MADTSSLDSDDSATYGLMDSVLDEILKLRTALEHLLPDDKKKVKDIRDLRRNVNKLIADNWEYCFPHLDNEEEARALLVSMMADVLKTKRADIEWFMNWQPLDYSLVDGDGDDLDP